MARFCRALAALLWRRQSAAGPPAIMIGSDGHWTTAELIALACESLELAGCRTIEAAAVTTAPLVAAAHQQRVQACLWIGNPTGRPHAMGLRVWGGDGRPWSSPGTLDEIHGDYTAGAADRQSRRGGGRRGSPWAARISIRWRQCFTHCGRCGSWSTPCASHGGAICDNWRRTRPAKFCAVTRSARSGVSACGDPSRSYLERRLELLGADVVARQAHFGVWIDGAGAACRIVDERGKAVPPRQFFGLLAAFVCGEKPGATLAIDSRADSTLPAALAAMGAQVVAGGSNAEQMFDSMQASGSQLGFTADGTCWWSGMPPTANALLAVCLLLRILSESDRVLSEVLDAACALR